MERPIRIVLLQRVTARHGVGICVSCTAKNDLSRIPRLTLCILYRCEMEKAKECGEPNRCRRKKDRFVPNHSPDNDHLVNVSSLRP